ncbi:Metallo-dependent phosphatase-like protein [Aspergillus cavernicola]|uniref:Metallo-dependent phosphatase-like protein n=1 Tax=Aspergillus cavernicola TaxID=176166 RepID=A0ABR4HXJ8_9EURO
MHNATPALPPGDILIHAGDLTAHGTFDEVHAQLRWLSFKLVIAGNHDILLDEASDERFITRREEIVLRRERNWIGRDPQQLVSRRVKIYGSPWMPEFGSWAFQYPPICDVWTGRVPDDTDILTVHGPPALHGDRDGEQGLTGKVKVKGDGYLLREIRRVKPKIVVCGHIHGVFGLAVIQHDGTQDVMNGL